MTDDLAAKIQALYDRQQIEDTLYRYASSIDVKDYDTLRSIMADDVEGIYGDRAPFVGPDALVGWIADHGRNCTWQHHLLNVYHVDIEGDTAQAVTYHTSHQATSDAPGVVRVIGARYYDTLRRSTDGRWLLIRKRMDVLWRDTRTLA